MSVKFECLYFHSVFMFPEANGVAGCFQILVVLTNSIFVLFFGLLTKYQRLSYIIEINNYRELIQ